MHVALALEIKASEARRSRTMALNATELGDAVASFAEVSIQERVVGDVRWVAVRARGADWSWLTPEEAAELAHEWSKRYGNASPQDCATRRLAA
jgi:hypothetical protein